VSPWAATAVQQTHYNSFSHLCL